MRPLLTKAGLFVALLLSLSACDLFCDCEAESPKVTECAFSYPGDNGVFVPTDLRAGYFITPAFQQSVPTGTFAAEPEGLDIDRLTGTINVNTSEAGLRYIVRYVSAEEDTICETPIIISGIDYLDSIYVLGEAFQAAPIFDASSDSLSTEGLYDEAAIRQLELNEVPASASGLVIDNATGAIDLRGTIESLSSLEGTLENGFTREFEIFYVLGGRQFLNSTSIQIFYYQTRGAVPPELERLYREKKRYLINGREDKKRPSYIIIVGQ